MKIGMKDIKLRTPRREFILTGAVSHRVFYVTRNYRTANIIVIDNISG